MVPRSVCLSRLGAVPLARPGGQAPDAGFVLPLSLGAALMLLLTSLSVQTAALQGSALAAAELKQRQQEDALDSAAQRVAAQLSGAYACLLPQASADWVMPVAGCAPGLNPAMVAAGQVGENDYRVVGWTPALGGKAARPGELRLELSDAGSQRLYALAVVPGDGAPLVRSVRGLGR
ncbi:hypothetical protein KBY93_09085 [Synechococcus sp. J7-Johnson]|nr:hypothetical protein [Synechococcus sp. J7-Johnson]